MTPTAKALFPALLLAIPFSMVSHAQTAAPDAPVGIGVCELLMQPAAFDGKLVQIRGEVHLAFEDFSFHDPACADAWPEIWLEYAHGAEPTPYAPFNNPALPPKVSETDDSSMKQFRKAIAQKRVMRPDGTHCWDRECDFFRVTATITGHFLAIKSYLPTAGGGRIPNGYGHLGCCHLLIIEKISSVDAVPTPVPKNKKFSCSVEKRQLTGEEVQSLRVTSGKPCPTYEACENRDKAAIAQLAFQWSDHSDFDGGWLVTGESDNGSRWYSKDLLLSYWVVEEKGNAREIDRETCSAIR
jgi:hypothetical protein